MAELARGDVSIVVPAYAEERRIGRAVRTLRGLAAAFPRLREILVVIEPSGDDTAGAARAAAEGDPRVRLREMAEHRGKGRAVRTGMLEAAGDIVFFMDADLSVPVEHVELFVTHLDAHPGTAAAIGNRRHPASVITRRQSVLREQAGRLFNRAVRLSGLSASRDTQCGFKAFRRAAAREIFGRARIDGFAFDAEILRWAAQLGHRVDELPVEWINDAETRFRPLRDGWRSLADLWRVRRMMRARPAAERVRGEGIEPPTNSV
jgi:dolichyl-phosphate beta-glucosyltransferase